MSETLQPASGKLIVTRLGKKIITAIYENTKMVQVNAVDEADSILGNIYIGKVKNIVRNINAAFVDIGNGRMCYLSLEDVKLPILTKSSNGKIHAEAEVVVQVEKDNVKTKAPVLTTSLSFTGRYVVLIHAKPQIGISGKIAGKAERERLRSVLSPYVGENYGFIVRTNASAASDEEIIDEVLRLREQYNTLVETCIYKTVYSCLSENEAGFINTVRDSHPGELSEVVTDDCELYNTLTEYFSQENITDICPIRFVPDGPGSLIRLYSVKSSLKEALSKNVWLKSGGYLVIEPTEALTVIDVNTGKAINGKKNTKTTFHKINMEAAAEIARQIKLRNISGIIIIDFINLDDAEYQDELMNFLKSEVKKDSIKTTVVDMTKLELVELTRKKTTRPLHEQINMKELN